MTEQKEKTPGDYEVGYGRPPKHTRFKPGEQRNHKRGGSRARSLAYYIEEELAASVTFTDDKGRRRKIPKAKALAIQMVNQSLKTGDGKRLKDYLPKSGGEQEEPFSQVELETIARFLDQYLNRGGEE